MYQRRYNSNPRKDYTDLCFVVSKPALEGQKYFELNFDATNENNLKNWKGEVRLVKWAGTVFVWTGSRACSHLTFAGSCSAYTVYKRISTCMHALCLLPVAGARCSTLIHHSGHLHPSQQCQQPHFSAPVCFGLQRSGAGSEVLQYTCMFMWAQVVGKLFFCFFFNKLR